ncbi:MAG: DUF4340 domain-containing protein [Anaerolineae bacterium]|jgi:hypothetical protein|nr:DUF4340 domain-containing protein [Anaerolineae bacterium]
MKRHQQILLGVLVLQVILSVVVFWPRQVSSGSGEPIFPDLTVDDVVGLTVTDNTGGRILMRKVDGAWLLPEAGDYPVKEDSIKPVIEKLITLDKATLVARSEANHNQLEVAEDKFQRRLDVETADGKTVTIFLGTAPRYTATHFRVSDQPETYLTTAASSWEFYTRPTSWVDTSYIAVDQATVTGAVLENAQGIFTFVKSGEDWTLADLQEGETISAGATNAIVRNASTLSLSVPLGKAEDPAYGLDAPNAVVTLETEDGATHVLLVGAKNADDNTYVVKASDSPYYVRVSDYLVSAMVENGRESFLTVPPTPEPESTATPAP